MGRVFRVSSPRRATDLDARRPGAVLLIEDVTLADGLDLVLDPGFETALVEGFDVEVTDGVLDIEGVAPGQRAMVAALEIERLGPDHSRRSARTP